MVHKVSGEFVARMEDVLPVHEACEDPVVCFGRAEDVRPPISPTQWNALFLCGEFDADAGWLTRRTPTPGSSGWCWTISIPTSSLLRSIWSVRSASYSQAPWSFTTLPRMRSWLNMAEIELSVFSRQCLNRRVGDEVLRREDLPRSNASATMLAPS